MTRPAPERPLPEPPTATLPATGTRSIEDRLAIAVFMLVLIVPALALLAGVRPPDLEGGEPAVLPAIDATTAGDPATYAKVDRWVAESFPLRTVGASAYGALDYGLLGGSPNPDVIVGHGDWLFTATELEPVCRFTAAQVLDQLDAVAASLAEVGMDFRFTVPPDKHVIYPEQVVPGSGLGASCADQRQAELRAGMTARPGVAVEVWSALEAVRAADPERPIYFEQDTHWTPLGALVATEALIESLAPDLWSPDQVPTDGFANYETDLSRLIGLPARQRVPKLVIRPGVTVTEGTIPLAVDIDNARDVATFAVDPAAAAVEGRTLVVYDSFYGTNMRRIAPWFRDSVWVHYGDLTDNPALVASLPAFDRVVVARVERGVYDSDLVSLLSPIIEAARARG
jgi:alginate O-acetyltransferase complex protein AlgJ